MDDKTLLEKAARAAGIEYEWHEGCGDALHLTAPDATAIYWNPLTDDGDALRLAVKLMLTVQQRDDHVKVGWQGCIQWIGEDNLPCDISSRDKATRRAIVRAAAALSGVKE